MSKIMSHNISAILTSLKKSVFISSASLPSKIISRIFARLKPILISSCLAPPNYYMVALREQRLPSSRATALQQHPAFSEKFAR